MKIDKQTQNTVLFVGGIVAAYFFLIEPIAEKLGLKKTKEEKELISKEKKSVAEYVQSTLKKQQPTKSKGEWNLIAQQIYENLGYSIFQDNYAAAGVNLTKVVNDADVATLIDQFGKRQEYTFGIPTGPLSTLPVFVTRNLSRQKIDAINDNYRRKNIKFRF
jgi:hypothetical protein